MNKILSKKNILILIGISLIIRLFFVFFYYNYNDLITYNYQWVKMIKDYGILNIYQIPEGIYSVDVDYPPIFLILLSIISPLAHFFYENNLDELFQFAMKLFPLMFDISIIVFLYRKFSPKASLIWALNPGVIINSSMWGQTDAMLAFFLILMMYYINKKDSKMACISFAFCCLTKLQGAYLLPILLAYLITDGTKIINKIKSLMFGALTGLAFFLPFMISNKNILLPLDVYLYGGTKYNEINCGAANFHIFEHNATPSPIQELIAPFLIIFCMLLFAIKFHQTKNLNLTSCFYLYCVFMITFTQRERYSFCAMTVLLLLFVFMKEKKYAILSILSGISLALNQIGPLDFLNYQEHCKAIGVEPVYDILVQKNTFIYIFIFIALFINIIIFTNLNKQIKKERKKRKENVEISN